MDEMNLEISQELMQLDNIEIKPDLLCFLSSEEIQGSVVTSESEGSDEDITGNIDNTIGNTRIIWTKPQGNQRDVKPFTEKSGLPSYLCSSMQDQSPADFFRLMVPNSLFKEIAYKTNLFADDKISKTEECPRFARLRKWVPTDAAEIKKFFGLMIFMGLTKLPTIAEYWSTDEIIGHPFPRKIMSRNRFEIILQMLNFSLIDEGNMDHLHRIRDLLQVLNEQFQMNYIPGEELWIDKRIIPFHGNIVTNQNVEKREDEQKYGIKEYKLECILGYTYKINVYVGKNNDMTPYNVVMDLCSDRLNKGHTLYTDDWYTSMELARALLVNGTHLVGTVRKNRRHLPQKVITKKLEKGESIARESRDGITVMKWKNKKEVMVLSSKHSNLSGKVKMRRGNVVLQPQIITDYNRAKRAVGLLDQMAVYSTPLRKSVMWYKKLAIDLILTTAMGNALTLYKSVTNIEMTIVDFRRSVMKDLCQIDAVSEPALPKNAKHNLEKKDGLAKKVRRTCRQCYAENVSKMGSKLAKSKTSKVVTYCRSCPGQPFLCLICFNKLH